jgi:hypothetical protein
VTRTIILPGPVIATRQRAAELRTPIEAAIAGGEFVRIDFGTVEVCSLTAMDELTRLTDGMYAVVGANRDVGEMYASVVRHRQEPRP